MRHALFALLLGCVGTTGGEIVTFTAAAAGPDRPAAGNLEFTSGRGYHVVLTKAVLHIGAVYLNQSLPVSGAQATNCILPGTYVAEETTGRDIDLLDPTPQNLPDYATGTSTRALVAEVWLKGPGSINATDDSTPILVLEGTADKNGTTIPFAARLTIGSNRLQVPSDPSQPGAKPICKERIVSPIPIDVVPAQGGTLMLRIDPRAFFVNAELSELHQFSQDPPLFGFADSSSDQPSISLYEALRSSGDVYQFEWVAP
jgi:hypothetical protein